MFTYEEMIKEREIAEKSIEPRVLKVFKEHKEELFSFMPIENQTGKPRKSYVYEWQTGDGKIFYVGKGVGNRINHIVYDELKNDTEDGVYNKLNKEFGISGVKVIEGLTDWEAAIYEIYQIWLREQQGEILLQTIDATSYWGNINEMEDLLEKEEIKPFVYLMPYHKRYYNYKEEDFRFDECEIKNSKGIYLYSFKNDDLKQKATKYFENQGIKVYKSHCKAVDTVFVAGLITSQQYLWLKKKNCKINHIKQLGI
ncbi:MAG: hypothetical protein IKI95_03105 [Clostridia bacterium]|nr:hypothetical protein [Clostridia bacterium]